MTVWSGRGDYISNCAVRLWGAKGSDRDGIVYGGRDSGAVESFLFEMALLALAQS